MLDFLLFCLLIFKIVRQFPASFKGGANGFFFLISLSTDGFKLQWTEHTKYVVVFGGQLSCLWPVARLVRDIPGV